jgi:hypothetical protein
MNMSMTQMFAAIVMVGVAFLLFYAIRWYMAAASERRMMSMLERVGLDPAIAASGDTQAIMREIRQRCRSCNSENVCERWLVGEESGENEFCPNAAVFESMKKTMGDNLASQGL